MEGVRGSIPLSSTEEPQGERTWGSVVFRLAFRARLILASIASALGDVANYLDCMSAEDKLAVAETVYRYAVGIDTRDFGLYRSIFDERVAIDFTSYSGGDTATVDADEWVGRVRPLFMGLAATQHSMTNPMVRVDGDRADCRMYMQAHHVLDPDRADSWFTIGGFYDDTMRRAADAPAGWLLTGVTLTVLWRMGDPSIMATAAARGAAVLRDHPQ
jgi:hypothetical protein